MMPLQGKGCFAIMSTLKSVIICLAFCFAGLWGNALQAQENNVFFVSGVEVDVTAASARDARNIALTNGQREAFSQLYRKVVAEEDWAYEPTLANDQLAPLVQGFDVHNERSSDTRYIATLDVSFNADRTREILGGLGVSYAETRTKETLILPLLSLAGTDILWGSQNIWLDAWKAYPTGASLIHYVLPKNDLKDQRLLSPRHLLALRPDRISAHLSSYELEDVIIAHANVRRAGLTGTTSLNVKTYRGAAMVPLFEIFVSQQNGESLDDLLKRTVDRIDSTLSEAWKAKVLIQYGSQDHMSAVVQVRDFEAWRAIIQSLDNIAQIRSLNIESLAFEEARLSFDYYGGLEQLRVALGEQGLFLLTRPDNGYEIATEPTGVRQAQVEEQSGVRTPTETVNERPVLEQKPDGAVKLLIERN